MAEFLVYFTAQWLQGDLINWYEGGTKFNTTNNGLESRNGWFKKEETQHVRIRLVNFVDDLVPAVGRASFHDKPFVETPTISKKLFIAAHRMKFSNLKKKKTTLMQENLTVLQAHEDEVDEATFESLSSLRLFRDWATFDDYVSNRNSVLVLRRRENQLPTCTCFDGAKKKPCKHALFIGSLLGVVTIPEECKGIPLKTQKKRGRKTGKVTFEADNDNDRRENILPDGKSLAAKAAKRPAADTCSVPAKRDKRNANEGRPKRVGSALQMA